MLSWLGLLLAVLYFAYLALSPRTQVELGWDTTVVTEPLAEDGLPNYALAILEKQREGVTPESNGAIPFWRAIGIEAVAEGVETNPPTQIDFEALCTEIGLGDFDAKRCLVDPYGEPFAKRLQTWLDTQNPRSELEAFDCLDLAIASPWGAKDCPPLAAWVEENEHAFDWLTRAGTLPQFFSPSMTALTRPEASLIDMNLAHAQAGRAAARALSIRMMHYLDQGDFEAAWGEYQTMIRLSLVIDQGHSIVEDLITVAIQQIAFRNLQVMLDDETLSLDLARRAYAELSTTLPRNSLAETYDLAERFQYLDGALRVMTGRFGGPTFVDDPSGLNLLGSAIDSNALLREGNQWYDRLVAAASIEDRQQRRIALAKFSDERAEMAANVKSNILPGLIDREARTKVLSHTLLSIMLPALHAADNAMDRHYTLRELTRIAAALAIHRLEHGNYPEKLEELTPAIMETVPNDLYTGKPYRYGRRGEGYLLYSLFNNEVDDGGDDYTGEIIDGEWVDEKVDIDYLEESDLVIRMPLPKVEWPKGK